MTATSRSMTYAIFCAAVVAAQFAAGKATRDALFFTSLHVTTLPAMVTATSVCSIVLVVLQARAVRFVTPARLVPAAFTASGLLFAAEWLFRDRAPAVAAVVLYLHVSGAGPLLASGFWLIASERFNPRTAKKGFGRIAAAGTVGSLLGALLAERVAAVWGGPLMVLILAMFQFAAAALVGQVARAIPALPAAAGDAAHHVPRMRGGLRVIADAPYLRNLSAMVLLGTTSAAVLDYVFKARAVETFGGGDALLRFFAMYYAGTSLIALVLQTATSRTVLERFGLGLTASTPSIALLAGSAAGLIAPGFGSLVIARGGESVFRSSLFRSGYELFFTPLPPAEKRAAKSVIDVAFDRIGDAAGAAFVRIAILLAPAAQSSVLLLTAMATAAGAIAAASRLNRWYLRTLESRLVERGGDLTDAAATVDPSTAIVVRNLHADSATRSGGGKATTVVTRTLASDRVERDIAVLRSGRAAEAQRILTREDGPGPELVPHVIPLLASDALADYALFALRKVAEERVGQLTDALLDPNQDHGVRRRLARVFSIAVSQRAADGLMLALDDPRFDVRFQTVRSLAAIVDRNPRIVIDRERIYRVVLQEVTVSRPVWESQRLLDGFVSTSPLDAFVRDRAGQSLAHVFTLLSLVLPREPLQIAFRSLHSEDAFLRGTALEYLDGVLPPAIRQRLWPFLSRPRVRPAAPPRTHVIADLLRTSPSETIQGFASEAEIGRVLPESGT
jgi:ATP:ADP antiporter, AAA family